MLHDYFCLIFEPSRMNPHGFPKYLTGEFITLGTILEPFLSYAAATDLAVRAVFASASQAFFHHPIGA
jgi:hypothetical protein